jgi:hypothetical protein
VVERASKGAERKDEMRLQIARRRTAALDLYGRFNAGNEQGSLDAVAINAMPKATLEQLQETPYAALQAVTELVDWGGSVSDQVAVTSGLFGLGATSKQAAWKVALEMATS